MEDKYLKVQKISSTYINMDYLNLNNKSNNNENSKNHSLFFIELQKQINEQKEDEVKQRKRTK